MTEPWEMDEEEGKKPPTPLDDKIDEALLRKKIIVINGELKADMVDKVCRRLIFLGTKKNKKPVKVILNSVGGEVYLGLLIFNTIKDLVHKNIPVEIETRGLAASMGCYILQAGSKRIASKYSRFLIHEITSYNFGKSSEVKEQAEETIKTNNMLREILAERTGKTAEEIEKIWHKRDVWMSPQEALEFGLIDEIV